MRSERMSQPFGTGNSSIGVKPRIGFEARHDPAAGGIEPGPPAIIVIAEIEDIGRAGFDRHLLGRGDVVDIGRADRGVDRAIGVRVVDDMRLSAAHAGREPRPAGTVLVQSHARGIDEIDGVGELAAKPAMGLLHHQSPTIRQRPPPAAARSHRTRSSAEPARRRHGRAGPHGSPVPRRSRAGSRSRQLTVKQRHELALGRQPPHPRIRRVCLATSRSNACQGTCLRTEWNTLL